MPQQTQIIPKWKHPHVHEVINDNTLIPDDGVNIVDFAGVNTLILTTADQGRDNELIDIRTVGEMIEEFGYPSMKKHGQALYNAHKFLKQVNYERRAWMMRVLPDDAAFANSIVVARVKATAGTPEVPGDPVVPAVPGSLSVKIEVLSAEDLNDAADLAAQFATLRNTAADAQGYATYPLFAVMAKGRGVYGNSIRYRVTKDGSSDEENVYTNYYVQLYNLDEDGLRIKKTVTGSLYEGALDGVTSINLEDSLEASNDPKIKVDFRIDQESLDELYELYTKTVGGDDLIELDEFDFLYGYKRNSEEKITGYNIEAPALGDVTLDTPDAVPLLNGHDGILDPVRYQAAFDAGTETRTREEIIDELFTFAIRGDYDRRINSRRRAPLHYVMDANYNDGVKDALTEFALARGDFNLTLDAGLMPTLAATVEWLNDYEPVFRDRLVSQECSMLKIRDPYSGRKIAVTSTYYLIGRLVSVYGDVANLASPVTGPRGELTDTEIVTNSLVPAIDEDDFSIKDRFFAKNVNIYIATSEKVFSRLSQQTTQEKNTDLSEENNMRVLLDIRRLTNAFCNRLLYSTTQDDDIKNFTEQINAYATRWFPALVQTISMEFAQSEWERKRNILHCYVAVVFKGIAKRIILEIDVNPRD